MHFFFYKNDVLKFFYIFVIHILLYLVYNVPQEKSQTIIIWGDSKQINQIFSTKYQESKLMKMKPKCVHIGKIALKFSIIERKY